jgi:hypothetical protein
MGVCHGGGDGGDKKKKVDEENVCGGGAAELHGCSRKFPCRQCES